METSLNICRSSTSWFLLISIPFLLAMASPPNLWLRKTRDRYLSLPLQLQLNLPFPFFPCQCPCPSIIRSPVYNYRQGDIHKQQQMAMKKTHTKNMLSMAPTLHMFTKHSQHKEQKPSLANYPAESITTASKNTSLKYNRSISSSLPVRKNNRESPDKKFSGLLYGNASKSRPTLPKGMVEAHPYEKIVEILGYQISARSEENLYEDFVGKMDGCVRILEDSMQSQTVIRVFRQMKVYFSKIFSLVLKLNEKQLSSFNDQVITICSEYESKLKEAQLKQRQRIKTQFLKGESQIGKKIEEIKARALFNTRIFNQIEYSNMDMMSWVKESEALNDYISLVEGHEDSQQIKLKKQTIFRCPDQLDEGIGELTKKQELQLQFEESVMDLTQNLIEKTAGKTTKGKKKQNRDPKLNKSG